jgi:hypothetical protein
MTLDLERIVGTGDRLVSIHRWRAKARHTGIEFDVRLAHPGRLTATKAAVLDSRDDRTVPELGHHRRSAGQLRSW